MKTTQTLLLGAVAAALLTATATVRAADFSVKDLSNRAIAASPHAKEQFPQLARVNTVKPVSTSTSANNEMAKALKNRAYAASPRAIEQFPWLARGYRPQSTTETIEVAPLK